MYKYYQPNEKDLKDNYGDCTIRALSKALNKSWIDTFNIALPFIIENQCLLSGLPLKLQKQLYGSLGFVYNGISNKKGSKRPTVKGFSANHKDGIYLLNVSNHVVCSVNGNYYDTWDSGDCCLYGYFELKK